MLPEDILIRTKVANADMRVRDIFEQCLQARVQSLPYSDETGAITGRITLKNIINRSIVPAYLAELAPVISTRLSSFDELEARMLQVFEEPVAPYVQEPHASVYSDTELMKALAIMEHHDTSYLFVIDGADYKGTLTIQGIAAWMMRLRDSQGSES